MQQIAMKLFLNNRLNVTERKNVLLTIPASKFVSLDSARLK